MRQIVLDTETTGIGAEYGHRIIEIGCVELINRKLTGKHFHTYLNPERKVDPGAFKVHGLSDNFLQDKPLFREVMADFLAFIGDAELIIHNAVFDLGFLNAELKRTKYKNLLESERSILDTLVMAREKHPGQRNSLDALCKRYDVVHFKRDLHGALLDAEILAAVYLAMTGGQIHLHLDFENSNNQRNNDVDVGHVIEKLSTTSPVIKATELELERHQVSVAMGIKKSGVDYWT